MGTSEGGCTGAVGEARRGQASERQVRGAACESGPCPPHSGTGSSSASASLGPGYSTECRWSEEEGSGLRGWLPSTTTRSCWTPATPSPARPFPQPQGASPPHTHTRCRSTGEWGRDKKSDPMAPPAGNERATPGHSPAELKKWHLQTPNSEAPSAGTGMMESQDCSHKKVSHTPGDSGKQFRELRKKINEQKEVETKKEADKFRS